MSFGKIFESMYTGSMVGAGAEVFAIMPYCISHATPPNGLVELNPKLIAAILGIEKERVEKAIDFLTSPDPESRSKQEEGRRLVREGQFIYRLVNFAHYRELRDEECRREYQREWIKSKRRKAVDSRQMSTDVDGCLEMSTKAEAEAEAYNTEEDFAIAPSSLPSEAEKALKTLGKSRNSLKTVPPLRWQLWLSWSKEYPLSHGGVAYEHQGLKTDKAMDALLENKTPEEVMEVARRGWASNNEFIRSVSSDFSSIKNHWNKIRIDGVGAVQSVKRPSIRDFDAASEVSNG